MPRRFPPLRIGFFSERLELPLDLKNHDFDLQHYFDRAERALDRFTNFPNGQASPKAIRNLIDELFVASQAIWHFKDPIVKMLEGGARDPSLLAFLKTPHQRALYAIANSDKHAGLKNPDKIFPGRILLNGDQSSFPEHLSLADFYRLLELRLGNDWALHPADFLTQALAQWNRFAWDRILQPAYGKPGAGEQSG